jgi:hypothetical protein
MDIRYGLYGLLALVGLILILRFGRALARGLLWLLGGVIGLALFVTLINQARATRQAATAATVATTGQTVSTFALTLLTLLVVLLLLLGGGAIVYLVWRLKRVERRRPGGRWLPGPNARWERTSPPAPDTSGALQALVQLELVRLLHELRAGYSPTYPPPARPSRDIYYYAEEEDDAPVIPAWWT